MSQRLDELHRQRRLVEEHLTWLNREIAAELIAASKAPHAGSSSADSDTSPAATLASATTTVIASAAGSPNETRTTAPPSALISPVPGSAVSSTVPPEALIDEFRVPPDALRDEVRKGCFLYLALAFGLLTLGIAVLYFLFRL